MHAYFKTAVLTLALGLASAAPAAGQGGISSSAASSSAASTGAGASGGVTAGGSTPAAGGGAAKRSGGGMYGIYRSAPPLDPARKINEQDCTKPIVHDAGNLRCM
jgi:hypothetical protein